MKWFLVAVLLLLVAVVFGAAGWFGYQLYVKPAKLDEQEAKQLADAPPPTPLPDYSIPAFEKAIALKKEGNLLEARTALLDFLTQYPQSTKLAEAKDALSEINTQFVFTSMPGPDKIDYTVVSGDSLIRVASKTNSSAELILRSNNLLSIDLQIGQQLRVPQLDTSIVINKEAKTLTLLDKGVFFKEYPILSLQGAGALNKDMTVKDKIALRGSDRVAFAEPGYIGSDRWIMLSDGNAIIRGYIETDENGATQPLPPGIVVSQEHIEEIFPLVTRGTPVTVQ